jgi:hypothetical protein
MRNGSGPASRPIITWSSRTITTGAVETAIIGFVPFADRPIALGVSLIGGDCGQGSHAFAAMQRSSESIACLAATPAEAQAELTNPEERGGRKLTAPNFERLARTPWPIAAEWSAPAGMGYCLCSSCRHWSTGPVNAFSLWPPQSVRADNIGTYHKTSTAIASGARLAAATS